MPLYDAFISYSHAKDKPIAAALQSVVQKLGKPWYQRRALRLFRDDTSLSATPQLWPTIEQALGESRYLILLASPEAAASHWVGKEVAYWLEKKSADTLLIAVTDGTLAWDNALNDFAPSATAPLPPALKGRFAAEPKWVDLTAYREGADKRDARFTELAADFAAAIRGMPKEDLLSQEVKQQRRTLRLVTSAAAAFLGLAVVAAVAGILAYRAQLEAVAQRNRAEQTLAAATQTANGMVFNLAQRFKFAVGIPVALVKDILDRAVALQQQLTKSGQTTPALRESEADALNEISFALARIGETTDAYAAADRARQLYADLVQADPGSARRRNGLAISYSRLGNALMRQSKYADALAAYEQDRDLTQQLVAADPANAEWQDNLSTANEKIGDALTQQGRMEPAKLASALDAYQAALAIRQKLNARDQVTDAWRFGLAVAYSKVGGALNFQRKSAEALTSYRNALPILLQLTTAQPGNSEWQNELAVLYGKIGEASLAQRSNAEALDAFQNCLAVLQRLLAHDPENGEWQDMSALAEEESADVLKVQGKLAEALDAYRKSLAIKQKLAAADPGNNARQNAVALILSSIGGLLSAQNKSDEALETYQQALEIWQKLVAAEPGNSRWRYGLSVLYEEIGGVLMSAGRLDEAVDRYQAALAGGLALVEGSPDNPFLQRSLSIKHTALGDALRQLGKLDDALAQYRSSLAIRQRLAAADKQDPRRQSDLTSVIGRIGALADRFILVRAFDKGLAAADEAIALAPDQLWISSSRAHALMFLDRVDEARALYLHYRGTPKVVGDKSWETVVLDDFADLRKAGLTHPLMDEIEQQFSGKG
jgi:tetratricopeptide (TPR) repeat protein